MIKKIFIICAVILLVLITTIILARNIIVKTGLSAGAELVTGLKLEVESVNVGILNTLINIKGLKLHNPPEFADKLMAEVPEIYVDYDLAAILKKNLHFEKVRLNLKEFIVIKNEKGILNLDTLKALQGADGQRASKEKQEAKPPQFKIDVLELKIGKVIYKDYSKKGKPNISEFNLNIDGRFENITDPNAFAALIVSRALKNTSISKIANIDLSALEIGASGTVKETVNAAKDTLKRIIPFGK